MISYWDNRISRYITESSAALSNTPELCCQILCQNTRQRSLCGLLCNSCQRTIQMSSIQNLALQVGQGTLLDNHVSGLSWSWRLANHRPRQDRHHMGLQKHCWQSDSLSAPVRWKASHSHVNTHACARTRTSFLTLYVTELDQFGVCKNMHTADTGLKLLCVERQQPSDCFYSFAVIIGTTQQLHQRWCTCSLESV